MDNGGARGRVPRPLEGPPYVMPDGQPGDAAPSKRSLGRVAALAGALVLAAAVWAVFWPVLGHGFVGYDEQGQIVENPLIRSLSPPALVRMFTQRSDTSYYPVRLLSLAVDYAVWGLDPTGYHLTNLLLHTANALLLYGLVLRLLRRRRRPDSPDRASRAGGGVWPAVAAALGAGLFALHPVVVEPVVWTGAREEVLMVFGALVCVHLHLSGRRLAARGGRTAGVVACHAGAVLGCVIACGSSAVGAAVPLIVTAWDLLARRRPRWWRLVAADAPLWAVGAATIVLKVTEPVSASAAELRTGLSISQRLLVAVNLYPMNLRAVLWPDRLSTQYPWRVPQGLLDPWVLWGLAAIAGTVAAGVLLRRRRAGAALVAGLAWFVLGLAPSSQLVPHHIYRADRFLYLPLVGLAVLAGAGLERLRRRVLRGAAAAAGVAVLSVWGVLAAGEVPVWRDSLSLFGRALEIDPTNTGAHYNLGVTYAGKKQYRKAIEHYKRALEVHPGYLAVLNNLGGVLLDTGRPDQAVAYLERAVRIDPSYLNARVNLGNALIAAGRDAEAAHHLRHALTLDPDDVQARHNLANLLAKHGQLGRAEAHYRRLLAVHPDNVDARYSLGNALLGQQKYPAAIEQYRRALQLDPGRAKPHNNLASAYLAMGRLDEAAAQYREAIRIDPRHERAHYNLANLLARRLAYAEAKEHFERAIAIRPGYTHAMYEFARLLRTCPDPGVRDVDRAVRMAERLCGLSGYADPRHLSALAECYAAAGRLDQAVGAAEAAIELAREAGREELAEAIGRQLQQYRDGGP